MYKTKRLHLKAFTEKDINDPNYRSWFYDQRVTKYNSHGLFPQTQEDLENFVEGLSRERLVLKIYVEDDIQKHIWIGNVSLQSFNWINRSAELACVIGKPEFWGKGYTSEACRIILYHGFLKMNLNRIWTGTSELNTGMQKVAKKIGMSHEGTSRQGMFLNGTYSGIFHYGILAHEFNFAEAEKLLFEGGSL